MASIRRRGDKWQVQIRRFGSRPLTRSFHVRKDAEVWARQTEVQIDRSDLPADPSQLERVTVRELVERYRDTVSVTRKRKDIEVFVLNAFLRHRICRLRLSELQAGDFASYRDERLRLIKPVSLKRELGTLRQLSSQLSTANAEDASDANYQYRVYMTQVAGASAAASPSIEEVTGTQASRVSVRMTVTAAFALK